MTLSKVEATFCERELGELVRTSSGVETALIATGDGFEVACVTRGRTLDAARVSGLASSVLALGRALARELDLKASRSAVMEADGGLVLLFVGALSARGSDSGGGRLERYDAGPVPRRRAPLRGGTRAAPRSGLFGARAARRSRRRSEKLA